MVGWVSAALLYIRASGARNARSRARTLKWLEELDMMHLMHNRRFLLAAIVVTAIGFASGADAQTSNEAVWQQFTDWLVAFGRPA
jgi:hypothetical protein